MNEREKYIKLYNKSKRQTDRIKRLKEYVECYKKLSKICIKQNNHYIGEIADLDKENEELKEAIKEMDGKR